MTALSAEHAPRRLGFSASLRHQRGWKTAIVFAAPALILFTLFIVLPVIEAGSASFFNWNGLRAPSADKFLGLGNYQQLLSNATFQRAVGNTLLIIAASLLIQLPLALAMAALLAGRQIGSIAFRMTFFLPFILADVASGLIFRFMFDGDVGILTQVSQFFGLGEVHLLSSKDLAIVAIIVVATWKYFGFHMMLYIAGMQAIDRSLYEAAAIDGATAWQRFVHITVPGLATTIRLSVFFAILGCLQFFDLVVPLTGGGPLNSSHTIVSFLYYFGIARMRVGFGDAVGVTLFIVCVVVALGYRRWVMRND
jgi:raffinose/stachyose/melibiose transport system permease protein